MPWIRWIKKKNHSSAIFNSVDFVKLKLEEFSKDDISDEEMTLFWKWVFLYYIAETLEDGFNKRWVAKRFCKPYKQLKDFLNKSNLEDIFKLSKFSKGSSSKLRGKVSTLPVLESEATVEETGNSDFKNKLYYEKISSLEKLIMACLKKHQVMIFFDDLDEYQNKIFSKIESNRVFYFMLLSMLDAAKSINTKIIRNKIPHSKIVILMRDDILSRLHEHSSNSNKLVTEGSVDLYWFTRGERENPWNHPIIDMVLSKIRNSTEAYSTLSNEILFNLLFPDKVRYKNVTEYLLSNSYGRPRDVIQYLSLIKKK
ncbi:P-loop ATPase, Sll1717 family [Listeria cornellensis]|uniref:P-loop ATPase, Sll1717 family n=1 Tax=Listeria cornellensis TaxID=1494961 RepID=UPI0004B9C729